MKKNEAIEKIDAISREYEVERARREEANRIAEDMIRRHKGERGASIHVYYDEDGTMYELGVTRVIKETKRK